jgi:endonuclease/exonuclease/phosphatase family metal-dependent hydrolase
MRTQTLPVSRLPWVTPLEPETNRRDTLRVMTLNVAHGRRDGFHQALQRRERIEKNLSAIAAELERVEPDLVALQEADGPSIWSGRFDHVHYLASSARFASYVRGEHVKRFNLTYGTALLSQIPLDDAVSVTFAPSPPTLTKGFVVGAVAWPGEPQTLIDVVSVHLDFARKSVRDAQVQELARMLGQRKRPMIVMGDFNCEWTSKGSPLKRLAESLGLKVHQPDAKGMTTFPTLGTRLDWVLISPELEFAGYQTLTSTLSDHLGVVAELKLARPKARVVSSRCA